MASHVDTGPPAFLRLQHEFAAHIRDPGQQPAPADIEDRRMAIYRELVYRNVESLLAEAFAVLRRTLGDAAWHALVRDYLAVHRARTPLFPEIPREFLVYLETERGDRAEDPPFLTELAHYEWVGLALSIAEDIPDLDDIDPEGDPITGIPVLSPLLRHLACRYPVHRIGAGFRPDEPRMPMTFLAVYRNRAGDVGYFQINAVTNRLLELLRETSGATGEELLLRIAGEMSHPRPGIVMTAGREFLRELAAKDIILGTRRADEERQPREVTVTPGR